MNIVYWVSVTASRMVLAAMGGPLVIGRDNIPSTGPVIVAANHVSYADPPALAVAIPRNCAFMARHDLWKSRVLGWILTRACVFPVHRESADRAAIRQALEYLKSGLVLTLFPEGTRSPNGELQEAHGGVALIIQKSGAPVVPAALINTERVMPVGSSRMRRARHAVVFGEPLHFEPGASREVILTELMARIGALVSKGRAEMP